MQLDISDRFVFSSHLFFIERLVYYLSYFLAFDQLFYSFHT